MAKKSRKKPAVYTRKANGYDFAKANPIIYPHYADILKIKGVKC